MSVMAPHVSLPLSLCLFSQLNNLSMLSFAPLSPRPRPTSPALFHLRLSAYRRVILMQLSLLHSGITYEPGDVIGIRCPNPPQEVDYVLERLKVR